MQELHLKNYFLVNKKGGVVLAERITIKRAAELTGLSELSVRYGIESGRLPIGTAIKRSEKRTLFHVSPFLLAQ